MVYSIVPGHNGEGFFNSIRFAAETPKQAAKLAQGVADLFGTQLVLESSHPTKGAVREHFEPAGKPEGITHG